LRFGLDIYLALLDMLVRIGRSPRPARDGRYEILLTGRFDSDNWAAAHLRPLAAATRCKHLYVVTTHPVSPVPKLTTIHPPCWLQRSAGGATARLLTVAAVALWRRPHIIGGFHLLLNGLVVALLSRLVGARAFYFCVGGPAEVLGGGIQSENRLFGRLTTADSALEQRLLRAARAFREHGIGPRIHVVSGGIDPTCFAARQPQDGKTTDLILVGRLAEIKRVDVFLHALQHIARVRPGVRALVVGAGEKRATLEALARELGITGHVTFTGHRTNVASLLHQARLFVLTSDSEGLALSMMEAMTCGLPAVVSAVGDLPDLVEHGVNGLLVPPGRPKAFARAILALLSEPAHLARFSCAATAAAQRYALSNAIQRWDEILSEERF
jgi:glycosyltransferase involved in cell wall biosynthesis